MGQARVKAAQEWMLFSFCYFCFSATPHDLVCFYYSITCLGRPLVWATTRLDRPQSPARIVSNNKVPGVSDHLPDATGSFDLTNDSLPAMNDQTMPPVEISDNNVVCVVEN